MPVVGDGANALTAVRKVFGSTPCVQIDAPWPRNVTVLTTPVATDRAVTELQQCSGHPRCNSRRCPLPVPRTRQLSVHRYRRR
jgi:hypothetical protein